MHLKNTAPMVLILLLVSNLAQAASLRGSKESLDRQAMMAKRLHLPRIKNVQQINQLLIDGRLRELPRQGETFYLDETIGDFDPMYAHMYRTASPAVIKFLSLLSRDFYNRFDNQRLKVTSLTRTVAYQKRLQRHNRNAVGASRSPHLTGAAIDISYKEMTAEERQWMRSRLLRLEREKILEATEERFQACFHIMVFRE